MRAAVVPELGPAEVLQVREDWPEPGSPGLGEVLIAVDAAGLNPSDVKNRAGGAPPEKLPYVAGREAAGRVLAVGDDVEGFAEGDDVFSFFGWFGRPGGHAEQVVIPASMVSRRPAAIPVTTSAAVPLAGLTAYQALRRLDVPRGATVGITGGAGGVGCFAVQLAAAAGLRVVTTASPDNHAFLLELGAAEVVDYHDAGAAGAFEGIAHLLDLVGPAVVEQYQDRLASDARVVSIVALPEKLRRGLWAEHIRAQPGSVDLEQLAELLESGKLRVDVMRIFPLEDIVAAHQLLEGGHVRGKLVIDLRG
jgi:NADPH:quinone reductase-like Zn-dependent oxidoreductase